MEAIAHENEKVYRLCSSSETPVASYARMRGRKIRVQREKPRKKGVNVSSDPSRLRQLAAPCSPWRLQPPNRWRHNLDIRPANGRENISDT
jgi:hypothetical protein